MAARLSQKYLYLLKTYLLIMHDSAITAREKDMAISGVDILKLIPNIAIIDRIIPLDMFSVPQIISVFLPIDDVTGIEESVTLNNDNETIIANVISKLIVGAANLYPVNNEYICCVPSEYILEIMAKHIAVNG
ncbi:hypothetical protein BK296_19225 [Escherichia coli]|nr:hypothetical protein [Escherichia coli]MCQ6918641.1 hypothetical protein [Escherichia coli]MCQ6947944.1 hypothetical protein [Escherichia coli]MDM8822330.1 hypothetical protein [Escherichia coli]MDM8836706.1 hypothetical protein [Escherichia coli]OJK97733.1 hypothetical protein BK251_01875 [Escherichia coli]